MIILIIIIINKTNIKKEITNNFWTGLSKIS